MLSMLEVNELISREIDLLSSQHRFGEHAGPLLAFARTLKARTGNGMLHAW